MLGEQHFLLLWGVLRQGLAGVNLSSPDVIRPIFRICAGVEGAVVTQSRLQRHIPGLELFEDHLNRVRLHTIRIVRSIAAHPQIGLNHSFDLILSQRVGHVIAGEVLAPALLILVAEADSNGMVVCCCRLLLPAPPEGGVGGVPLRASVLRHPSHAAYFFRPDLGACCDNVDAVAVFDAADVRGARSTLDAADAALALVCRELAIRGHLPSYSLISADL